MKSKKFFSSLSNAINWFSHKMLVGGGAVLVIAVAFAIGSEFSPKMVYAVNTEVKVVEVESPSPVLERIADCESGDSGKKGTARHFDLSGQVIMRGNTNKTVDVGKYQINSVWFSQASKLGLDLTKEEDNHAFALWLYKNKGTEDWYASKKCWAR